MSENTNAPAAGEVTEPTTVQVSEQLRALTAELKKAADQNRGELRAAVDKTEQLREDLKKEYARLAEEKKVKAMPDTGRRVKMADVLSGRVNVPGADEAKDLATRASIRMALRGNARMQKGKDGEAYMALPNDPEAWESIPEFQDLRAKAAADMWDTADSGAGTEWVPTGVDSMVDDFYAIRGNLLNALQRRTIPRGVGTLNIPVITANTGADLITETTTTNTGYINTATVGVVTTSVAPLTAKKHMLTLSVSTEGTEDMAVDAIATMRRAMSQNLIGAVEESVINAQTATDITLDDAPAASGLVSADGYDSAGDGRNGLRLHCVVNSHTTAGGGGVLTTTLLNSSRGGLGIYGVRTNEIAAVMGAQSYLGLLNDASVKTLDVLGPNATVITGQLASANGIPLLVSDRFLDTMDANGINAGTGALGGCIVFNRTMWTLGIAREIQIALVPQIGYDTVNLVGSVRSDFVNHINTAHTADYIINLI